MRDPPKGRVASVACGLASATLSSLATPAPPGRPLWPVETGPELRDPSGPLIACDTMRRLYADAARAARTDLPVLVLGETGSGKEMIARAVHDGSPRARAPFMPLNCATLSATLLLSTLFGHERGAFTGAERRTLGLFEQAQGGTIFLDEVGELSPEAQPALLRALEQKRIVRVGSSVEIDVDVRIVAATHCDLAAMVRERRYREDLLFRLDVLTLQVPPLRARKAEIPLLAQLFLARARRDWGASVSDIAGEAMAVLQDYHWPGNVRQLRNTIERAAVIASGDRIELDDLPSQLWTLPKAPAVPQGTSLQARMQAFEIAILRDALEQAQGNCAAAARMLGVPRRTLASKLNSYGFAGFTSDLKTSPRALDTRRADAAKAAREPGPKPR